MLNLQRLVQRFFAFLDFRFGIKKVNPRLNFHNIRLRMLYVHEFDTVIDVGANRGQWLELVRPVLKKTRVVAFEPVEESFRFLSEKITSMDGVAFQMALGSEERKTDMYVASNGGQSSSIKQPTSHRELHPMIEFNSRESINVSTLDSVMRSQKISGSAIYLKIDAQGNDYEVLLGAQRTLKNVHAIEIESSMSPEFAGETSHHKMVVFLLDQGFIYFTGHMPRLDSMGRQWDLNSLLIRPQVLESMKREPPASR